MSRLNILITTNIPSPYFSEYADELQQLVDSSFENIENMAKVIYSALLNN